MGRPRYEVHERGWRKSIRPEQLAQRLVAVKVWPGLSFVTFVCFVDKVSAKRNYETRFDPVLQILSRSKGPGME